MTAAVRDANPDDLQPLLDVLPLWVQEAAFGPGGEGVEELALDLGRPLAVRRDGRHAFSERTVTKDDLQHIVHRLAGFRDDDRTGLDGQLHRVSALRDRYREIVGLTARVGRAVVGAAEPLAPYLDGSASLLLVGPPGVGKTTLLRDATRLLSARLGPKVVVVDTSNEIGGDGRIPHPCIAPARRLQVPSQERQAEVMLRALVNHGPEAIVVDEIGFYSDAEAVATVARRGVLMVATAHGACLRDVLENPQLESLLGVSKFAARPSRPVFQMALEVAWRGGWRLHRDVAASVERLLDNKPALGEPVLSSS